MFGEYFDSLLDGTRRWLFLADSDQNAYFLNHSWSNHAVFLLLHNYAIIFHRLHSNSLANTVFVLHSENNLIDRTHSHRAKVDEARHHIKGSL
jgi:hypothetical protein